MTLAQLVRRSCTRRRSGQQKRSSGRCAGWTKACHRGPALPPEARAEVAAVAAWTDGIVALTARRMDAAAQAFDRAERGLRVCGRVDEARQTQVPKNMALSLLGRHDEATACALQAQRELLALGNLAAAGASA